MHTPNNAFSKQKKASAHNRGGAGFSFSFDERYHADTAPLIIGVTGGIGSGKTELCQRFKAHGAHVINADLIARQMMESNRFLKKEIEGVFGKDIYLSNGRLNRRQLSSIVFGNKTFLERLNSLVHPLVIENLQKQIVKIKKTTKSKLVIIEAALIYEASAERLFDLVILVAADVLTRKKRLAKRGGLSRIQINQRITAQTSNSEKKAKADFIVDNSGKLTSLDEKCIFLFHLFERLIHSSRVVKDRRGNNI